MTTINYCDYAAGDDTTGDGSAGNPYKTITKASTGLSGGDEVRVAKSPAHTALSGTLAWVDGSATVNTSEDLTGVLAAKDFVGKNSEGETWWEIASLTSSAITLVVAYRGTTATVASYKAGVTDTGSAAASSTVIQAPSASGSSGSLIKISGGWNLSGTPVQDGHTFFWQSGANKNGYGLYTTTYDYLNIEDLGFFRYNRAVAVDDYCMLTRLICNGNSTGIYLASSNGNTITTPTCNGNSYGIYLSSSSNNTITSATCNSNSIGIYLSSSSNNNTITTPTCNGNGHGIYLNSSKNNTITTPTCNGNSYGIYLSSSSNNTITTPTCNGNGYGIYLDNGSLQVMWGYAHDETIWSGAGGIGSWMGNNQKLVSIGESESGGAARNRVYFYGGYTQDNTAEADGGSGKCLQFNPKSETYWIEQDFNVPVTSGVARTVSIKMKDDASFNGTVELELWYNGVCIVGPTTKTMTTSYVAQEMTAAAGQITADGVLTLKVKVYGTAGAVYADTLSYT